MFDQRPDQRPAARSPYRLTHRGLLARARAPVWLALALAGCLLLAGGGLVFRSTFRDRYVPPTPGTGAAAILPSLEPTGVGQPGNLATATAQGPLYWTTLMVLQSDGSYAPPREIGAAALARFNQAVDVVNVLPWQSFSGGDLFTGDGLTLAAQAMALRDAPGGAFYAVFVPGFRQAEVVGCDQRGAVCRVRCRFGKVRVDAYDGQTRALRERLALPEQVSYTFEGMMVYEDGQWLVDDLTIPQNSDGQS